MDEWMMDGMGRCGWLAGWVGWLVLPASDRDFCLPPSSRSALLPGGERSEK